MRAEQLLQIRTIPQRAIHWPFGQSILSSNRIEQKTFNAIHLSSPRKSLSNTSPVSIEMKFLKPSKSVQKASCKKHSLFKGAKKTKTPFSPESLSNLSKSVKRNVQDEPVNSFFSTEKLCYFFFPQNSKICVTVFNQNHLSKSSGKTEFLNFPYI